MRKIARVLSLLIAVGTLFTFASVHALSNGLGISPRKDYSIQPGKSISDTIYINNLSLSQDLEVDLSVVDFGAQNETGAPALELGDNPPQTPWSLRPFIKLPSSVKVAAGKSSYIPITVTIPAGQGAGSYYSAIQYKAVNPETKQKVNITAATATLVFVTVPGNAKEQLVMKQFGAWQSSADQTTGNYRSLFIGTSPKELAYRLENAGNVAEQPSGSILIKNMFGRSAIEIQDANSKKSLALIGQTRRIQVCMKTSVLNDPNTADQSQLSKQTICDDPGLWPGHYTAEIALFYGMNGNDTQEMTATASFWYFPWWSIIGFVVLIVVIALLVWLIRRAFSGNRRRYRR